MNKLVDFAKSLDWEVVGLVSLLGCMSLLSLYSIDKTFFYRQLIWYGLSFLVIFLGVQVKWGWLLSQNWFRQGVYWFSCLLLLVPFLQDQAIRGVSNWVVIGNFQFDPFEVAKIGVIFVLAGFFSRRYLASWRGKNIAISFFYTLLPVALIALQPNLGSALVIFSVWFGFILMSGINKKRLALGVLLAVLFFSLMWFSFLEDYQKTRIKAFLNPSSDPLGANYNVTQSKIAIGSGGFWGKGFGSGSQTQLGFLPEPHTDFIFASFIEEWGVFGGLILVLTYLILVLKIGIVSLEVRSNVKKFLSLGAALVFLVHFALNIGSNLGLLPVIGVGLPFVSYGGSNLLVSSLLVGIVERIKIEQSFN